MKTGYVSGNQSSSLEDLKILVLSSDANSFQGSLEDCRRLKNIFFEIKYRMMTREGNIKRIWSRGKFEKGDRYRKSHLMRGIHLGSINEPYSRAQ